MTNNDIQLFFKSRFAELEPFEPLLLSSWTGESIIKQPADQAAGRFFWADRAVRFIRQGLPDEQLNMVLSGD